MGNLRFTVSEPQRIDPRVWQTAYITGIESIPWHCRHELAGDQFIISRQLDESGKLNIVWPTRCHGNLCLNTASLRPTESSYCLTVELARGTVGRLKSQTAEWQRMGLRLPESFFPLAETGQRALLRSVTHTDERQRRLLAQSAIERSVQASQLLCEAFAQQALLSRRHSDGPLTTLLGVNLPMEVALPQIGQELQRAFSMVNISAGMGLVEQASGQVDFAAFDRQIEWASQQQLKVCLGPLIDFRPEQLPRWMILLDEDHPSILKAACAHAESVVDRYRGQVHIWNCAAGLNSPSSLGWTDEEVLRMAVSVIETVRRADNRTPVLLTIEQPWGEYLRDDPDGISPLHFADALIRADLGLNGLALELNFDQWPGGSMPRDLIEINRLIDRWAMLGLPLLIYVSSPTRPASGSGQRVADWRLEIPLPDDVAGLEAGLIPPEVLVQLIASKPCVHAVIWNQLSDRWPTATDCSGLWDANQQPKPLLNDLTQLNRTFLQ